MMDQKLDELVRWEIYISLKWNTCGEGLKAELLKIRSALIYDLCELQIKEFDKETNNNYKLYQY